MASLSSVDSSTILSTPQIVIPPAPSPYVRFASLRHWFSRSEQTYEAAEARLLSRLAYFTIGGKTLGTPADSKTTAKVGLVDLDGDGLRKINTLVIDQKGNDFVVDKDGSISSLSETNLHTTNEMDKENRQLGFTHVPQTDLKVQSNTTTVNESKNSSVKNLVMCHGFGAGLGFFYRNYHGLSQVPGWKIYSIDWLGMGRSSRPKFIIKEKTVEKYVEETENFFIDSLEKWREIHQIDKMTLLGHSFGGYLAAVYALKYPMRVERLILVSPVGIPRNPRNDPDYNNERDIRQLPGWVVKLWNANFTPQLILRWLGPFGPSLVSKYTTRRFAHLPERDQLDLHDYIYHISTATGSGEFAITRLLEPGAYARKPLIDRLHEIKMPTTFLYGEEDWMDYRAAEKAKSLMKVPVKIKRIPDAGHHLYLDNPTDFNKAVIKEMLEVK